MKGEYETIKEAGAEVVAVSADSLELHERFCQGMGGCPFPLVSDEELAAAKLYGVLGEDGRRSHRRGICHRPGWHPSAPDTLVSAGQHRPVSGDI